MGYANDDWMNKPHVLEKARGGPTGKPPEGGMNNPIETVVPTTTVLVRFGGKEFNAIGTKPQPTLHGAHGLFGSARYGAWWMALDEYRKVEQFAQRQRIPVNVAVRQLCFVPREWNDLGTMVMGKLTFPLRAWTGVGNAVTGIDSTGHPRSYAARSVLAEQIVQLLIPGLDNGDFNFQAFQLLRASFLPTAAD